MIILFIISDKHMYPSIPCIPISTRPTSLPFFHRAACEFSLVRASTIGIPMFHHVSWASPSRKLSDMLNYFWLVVKKTISKNMNVKGKNDIPYIMENKTCLTPPTRYYNWDWFPGNSVAYIDSQFLEKRVPTYSIVQLLFPRIVFAGQAGLIHFLRRKSKGIFNMIEEWIMAYGFDFTWSIPLKRQCHGGNDDNPLEPAVPDFQGRSDGHPWLFVQIYQVHKCS